MHRILHSYSVVICYLVSISNNNLKWSWYLSFKTLTRRFLLYIIACEESDDVTFEHERFIGAFYAVLDVILIVTRCT